MNKPLTQRMEECCEEAVSTGYFTEDMLKRHGIGWLGRWSFMFTAKRSPDWEFWYYNPVAKVELSWQDVIDKGLSRKGLEMRWCPAGERR